MCRYSCDIANTTSSCVSGDFPLFFHSRHFRSRSGEPGTCEWSWDRKCSARGAARIPRDALRVGPAEQNDLQFSRRGKISEQRIARRREHLWFFPMCRAIRHSSAAQLLLLRAREAREGPPIYPSRKDFGSFAYYAIKVSLIEIPATFIVQY